MLPTGTPSSLASTSFFHRRSWGGESEGSGGSQPGSKRGSLKASEGEGSGNRTDEELTPSGGGGGVGGDEKGRVLVMNFLKNSIVNNPIVVSLSSP